MCIRDRVNKLEADNLGVSYSEDDEHSIVSSHSSRVWTDDGSTGLTIYMPKIRIASESGTEIRSQTSVADDWERDLDLDLDLSLFRALKWAYREQYTQDTRDA